MESRSRKQSTALSVHRGSIPPLTGYSSGISRSSTHFEDVGHRSTPYVSCASSLDLVEVDLPSCPPSLTTSTALSPDLSTYSPQYPSENTLGLHGRIGHPENAYSPSSSPQPFDWPAPSGHRITAMNEAGILDAFVVVDEASRAPNQAYCIRPLADNVAQEDHSICHVPINSSGPQVLQVESLLDVHKANTLCSETSLARGGSIKRKLKELLRLSRASSEECKCKQIAPASTSRFAKFLKRTSSAVADAQERQGRAEDVQLWSGWLGLLQVNDHGLHVQLVIPGHSPINIPVYAPSEWMHGNCISVPLGTMSSAVTGYRDESQVDDRATGPRAPTFRQRLVEKTTRLKLTTRKLHKDHGSITSASTHHSQCPVDKHVIGRVLTSNRQHQAKAPVIPPRIGSDADIYNWEVIQRNTIKIDSTQSSTDWATAGLLGEGTYGRVYLVLHKAEYKEMAMKVIYCKRPLPIVVCKGIANELRVSELLFTNDLPFVLGPAAVKDKWAWQSSEGFVHILTPFCPGGDLYEQRGRISHDILRLVVAELTLGIKALHELGIVHHDLKPENIVIDSRGHCRITDFGGAMFIPSTGKLALHESGDVVSTLPYAAPELMVVPQAGIQRTYTHVVDWWSLGAIIMSLVIADEYFLDSSSTNSRENWQRRLPVMVSGIESKLREAWCPRELISLVQHLLVIDPTQRYGAENIMVHPYFNRLPYTWEMLEIRDPAIIPPFHPVTRVPVQARGVDATCKNWPTRHASFSEIDEYSRYLSDELVKEGLLLEFDDSFDVPTMHYQLTRG